MRVVHTCLNVRNEACISRGMGSQSAQLPRLCNLHGSPPKFQGEVSSWVSAGEEALGQANPVTVEHQVISQSKDHAHLGIRFSYKFNPLTSY